MPYYSVVVRPHAERHLREAFIWYEEQAPGFGHKFFEAVNNAFAQIQASPMSFALVELGTRRLVLERFPYIIYFRAIQSRVEILAVVHGRRKPGFWKKADNP